MRFLISIPDCLHRDIKEIAQERGQTLTGLIREILWDWLKENDQSA